MFAAQFETSDNKSILTAFSGIYSTYIMFGTDTAAYWPPTPAVAPFL